MALGDPPVLMPLLRKLLLPLTWVCMAALTSCGVASNQPAQEPSQEAMPELGVYDDDDLNNSLDPGHSEALGEGILLDE